MYSLTYRRKLWPFKTTIPSVLGHSYHEQTDKLFVQTPNGGREIMQWKNCEIFLGSDWKAHIEDLERKHLEGK